jgi:general secretion pathway protein F
MPVYKYKAIGENGKSVEGIIDADSPRSAIDKLKRQSVYLSSLEEVRETKGFRFNFLRGISTAELSVTTRQFSTLISAGLPLEASLAALAEQAEDARLSQVLAEVRERVSGGSSLASALSEHPSIFSDMYVNIVRAGEASGTLDIVLLRLADFMEKQSALLSKVRSALIYPLFMMFVGSGVLFFMMTYVIPKITKIFEESRRALPFITVMLIEFSKFLSNYFILLLVALAVLIFALYRYGKTPRGKELIDRFTLKLPILGRISRIVVISRFARTLSTLLSSGIPLLDALEIVEPVVGNTVYRKAIGEVREKVREGTSFGGPLKETGIFPPLVTRMIAVGEHTGELEEMLSKIADTYDLQVETTISTLTSLIEPVMILVLGAVIGFIVFAILLPIFDLTSTIG